MFHCYSCRKAYGKVPSNKLWVFASGFPDGKKLESEELKAHFNEHKYHKQDLKINTGSQTLEEIESTPIVLSSTDKVQISLLLQDINFVVKKNRPISFVFDLMKHFDEKISLLKSSDELGDAASLISEKISSDKNFKRYNKIHCALTLLSIVIQDHRMKKMKNILF